MLINFCLEAMKYLKPTLNALCARVQAGESLRFSTVCLKSLIQLESGYRLSHVRASAGRSPSTRLNYWHRFCQSSIVTRVTTPPLRSDKKLNRPFANAAAAAIPAAPDYPVDSISAPTWFMTLRTRCGVEYKLCGWHRADCRRRERGNWIFFDHEFVKIEYISKISLVSFLVEFFSAG